MTVHTREKTSAIDRCFWRGGRPLIFEQGKTYAGNDRLNAQLPNKDTQEVMKTGIQEEPELFIGDLNISIESVTRQSPCPNPTSPGAVALCSAL